MCSDKSPPKQPPPPNINVHMPGLHDKPMSIWQRLPYRSDTGGITPMYLEGREQFIFDRMAGMTPERRAWRKKFLNDQKLSPREPVHVPEIYYEIYNPIRRFYMYPFNIIEDTLRPHLGPKPARRVRNTVSVGLCFIAAIYAATYYVLFHTHDWTSYGAWYVTGTKPLVYPGEYGYPFYSTKGVLNDEWADYGFRRSPLYKSEEKIKAEYSAFLSKPFFKDSK